MNNDTSNQFSLLPLKQNIKSQLMVTSFHSPPMNVKLQHFPWTTKPPISAISKFTSGLKAFYVSLNDAIMVNFSLSFLSGHLLCIRDSIFLLEGITSKQMAECFCKIRQFYGMNELWYSIIFFGSYNELFMYWFCIGCLNMIRE